jgi:RHS repeat-associated protein
VSSHKYWPFGTEAPGGDTDGERMKFTGHKRDLTPFDPNGLDYMHARYYTPTVGRFLSIDPTWASADLAVPQSWDRYTYVRSNPLRYTDPDGRIVVADDIAVGGFIGVMMLTAYVQAPSLAVHGKTNGQVMAASIVSGLTSLSEGVRTLPDRWKDFLANPDKWIKIATKPDPTQPPKGRSVREVWENPATGEIIGRHDKEPPGKTKKGKPKHPHPFEPSPRPNPRNNLSSQNPSREANETGHHRSGCGRI